MQNAQNTPAPSVKVGTPVYHPAYSKMGAVAAIEAENGNVFAITGGGLVPQHSRMTVVWEDETFTEVSESVARTWIDRAAAYGLAEVVNATEMLARAQAKRAHALTEAATRREEQAREIEAWRLDIRDRIPAGAKAVLIAELVADRSDIMTDYFGHTVTRTVVLGFSTHTRDLFPEMRKAALNFEETAHLFDAPESAEHRQKWSMGGGYFLKASDRHADGWKVSKTSIRGDDPTRAIPSQAEWKAPAPNLPQFPGKVAKVATDTAPVAAGGAFTVEEHTHTKKGFQMWIAVPGDRVAREVYDLHLSAAKALGGWWSRKWGTTPGGFAFKSAEAARAFAEAQTGDSGPTVADATPSPVTRKPDSGVAEKLRQLADGMQKDIDAKRADRLENTPKRQREAASARQDADRIERAQKGLRALADLTEAGNVPAILAKVTTKKKALELAGEKIDYSGSGYYDAGRPLGEPSHDTDEARAFWNLLTPKSAEDVAADEAKRQLAEISRCRIPGYFPTPAEVATDLVRMAGIRDGDSVLEPEAGSGAILDAIKAAAPAAKVRAYEVNPRLCEFLRTVGHTVELGDFLEKKPSFEQVDAVVMNPPFEKGQDMDHVRHAFEFLKPGGRLVAITSPGWTFRNDSKAAAFRAWLENLDHYTRDLPAGTFKESGTGTASVILYIDKPEA